MGSCHDFFSRLYKCRFILNSLVYFSSSQYIIHQIWCALYYPCHQMCKALNTFIICCKVNILLNKNKVKSSLPHVAMSSHLYFLLSLFCLRHLNQGWFVFEAPSSRHWLLTIHTHSKSTPCLITMGTRTFSRWGPKQACSWWRQMCKHMLAELLFGWAWLATLRRAEPGVVIYSFVLSPDHYCLPPPTTVITMYIY